MRRSDRAAELAGRRRALGPRRARRGPSRAAQGRRAPTQGPRARTSSSALMQQLRARTQGLLLLTATPMQVDPGRGLGPAGPPGPSRPRGTRPSFLSFFDLAAPRTPRTRTSTGWRALFRASEAAVRAMDCAAVAGAGLADAGASSRARRSCSALRSGADRPEAARHREAQGRDAHHGGEHTRRAARLAPHAGASAPATTRPGRISTRIADRDVARRVRRSEPRSGELYDAVEDYISTTYNAGERRRDERRRLRDDRSTGDASRAASRPCCRRWRGGSKTASEPGRAQRPRRTLHDDETRDEVDGRRRGRRSLEAEAAGAGGEGRRSRRCSSGRAALPDVTRRRACSPLDARGCFASGGYEKVMVFTQYTDTLDFLRDFLVGGAASRGALLLGPRRRGAREDRARGRRSPEMTSSGSSETAIRQSCSAPTPRPRA